MRTEIKNILDEYANNRAKEEVRVNTLIKKLIDENPEFAKARQEYSSIRAKQASAKLKGEVFDVKKTSREYFDTLKSACNNSGIAQEDLDIKYSCSDCKDTGYVGHNRKTPCHCVLNRVTKSILDSQNLNMDATFDNFDESIFPNDKKINKLGLTQREHILHIKDTAVKWCKVFPDTKRLQTLFMGATGVGKSYMTNCIAHSIIQKGFSVVNTTGSGINETMLKVIKERDNSLLSLFKTCDLLIIDDLGVEPLINNITVETLYEIIEYRLSNKYHTIICTNLSAAKLEDRYGVRLFSRISSTKNTALMQILGDDLRRL